MRLRLVGWFILLLTSQVDDVIASISTDFRNLPHFGVGSTSLVVVGNSPMDTLVATSANDSVGIMTIVGPSREWSIELAPFELAVGGSLTVGGAFTFGGADPPLRIYTASREAATKACNIVRAIPRAKRESLDVACDSTGTVTITNVVTVLLHATVVDTFTFITHECAAPDTISIVGPNPANRKFQLSALWDRVIKGYTWQAEGSISFAGQGIQRGPWTADAIQVEEIYNPQEFSVTSFDSLWIRAYGLSELRYVDETATPGSTLLPVSGWLLIITTGLGLIAVAIAFGNRLLRTA